MPLQETNKAITHTQQWIKNVVIACNFCPFAAKPFIKNSIQYIVIDKQNTRTLAEILLNSCSKLDSKPDIETTFIIFTDSYQPFDEYLHIVAQAETILKKNNLEGVYQVASFHPSYCFAGSTGEDASNYTNRSPYPMLHILREESITDALEKFPNPDTIPDNNIQYTQHKGLAYMQALLKSCF